MEHPLGAIRHIDEIGDAKELWFVSQFFSRPRKKNLTYLLDFKDGTLKFWNVDGPIVMEPLCHTNTILYSKAIGLHSPIFTV